MYFSITFGTEPDVRNTWEDWKLIPASPPMIAPPEPNLNLVEIPGRDEPIDLSTYPFGRLTYKPISGTWSFMFEPSGHRDRFWKYEDIRRWLHGRQTTIRLEEDPGHYFYGRLTVGQLTTGQGPSQIEIGYSISPLRYNLADDSVDETWLPDRDE